MNRLIFGRPAASVRTPHILAYRSEADRALEWLDKAVRYRNGDLSEILYELRSTNIHSDPRWLLFLESIGQSPEQMAAIEFKGMLPV